MRIDGKVNQIVAQTATCEEPIDNDVEVRRRHVADLRAQGIDPYPVRAWHPTHTVAEAACQAQDIRGCDERFRLAGRICARRDQGKAIFLDLLEQGAKFQLYVARGVVDERGWSVMDALDIGDFIGAEGRIFATKRGEQTLKVESLTILGKPTRGIPLGKRDTDGKLHQALADTGRLLRDRHIDLLVSPTLRTRIILRDRIIRELRAYFYEEDFTEIDTPVLGRAYSGAAATPFVTRSKTLDAEMFLRVSPECGLKQALCGDLPRVFEVGKNFRNEGIDRTHNPEFMAVEWYEAWTDYKDQMARFENLVARMAKVVSDNGIVHFRGRDIDFTPPWPRERMVELVAEHLGVAQDLLTQELMLQFWQDHSLGEPAPRAWGELVVGLFEECVQAGIVGPTFIIDHPVEGSPLTKRHRDDPRLVERFEPYVVGMEIGNAYSELNDPIEQRARLVEQNMARDERYGLDEQFLRAIEDGMPQAGGAGIGLDRIVMILTGAERLSDVILFPAT
jgi:lysyl-tRNA synthetase class 2